MIQEQDILNLGWIKVDSPSIECSIYTKNSINTEHILILDDYMETILYSRIGRSLDKETYHEKHIAKDDMEALIKISNC